MIQLLFDAPTASEALQRPPVEVGYSQHEGAERAGWEDDKLERVDGTHPVVHVAAGSHANFFGEALYLGSSAAEGVGCDDTRGRPWTFDRPCGRFRAIRGRLARRFRGSGSRVVGESFSGRSTTVRPARTSSGSGPSPSNGRQTGAVGATRFQQAACSATRQPTSSVAPSAEAPKSCGDSCTSRDRSFSCSQR